MADLKHRTESETAALIRRAVVDGDADALAALDRDGRIFAPITTAVARSSRARCRECGETIVEGADVVTFGFESLPISSAHVATAYLHAECPS